MQEPGEATHAALRIEAFHLLVVPITYPDLPALVRPLSVPHHASPATPGKQGHGACLTLKSQRAQHKGWPQAGPDTVHARQRQPEAPHHSVYWPPSTDAMTWYFSSSCFVMVPLLVTWLEFAATPNPSFPRTSAAFLGKACCVPNPSPAVSVRQSMRHVEMSWLRWQCNRS